MYLKVITPYLARPKVRKEKNLLSGNGEEEIEEPEVFLRLPTSATCI